MIESLARETKNEENAAKFLTMTIFVSHLHRNSGICLDYSSLLFLNYFVNFFNT